jgi:hypothetical protein
MRGNTDSKETATAQKQKGVFGSLRIQPRQKQVQEYIKNIYSIMSECVCEKFTIESLKDITCLEMPTNEERMQAQVQVKQFEQLQAISQTPEGQMMVQSGQLPQPQPVPEQVEDLTKEPTWEEVTGILRDDQLRSYTIDIETTATVFDDIESERLGIQQFTQTLTGMLQQTAQFAQQSPSTIDLMEQLTLLNIANFKISRSYVDSIKDIFQNIKREVEEGKDAPQAPDPAMLKLEADKQKMQLDAQKQQADTQTDMLKAQNDSKELALKEAGMVADNQLEEKKLIKDTSIDSAMIQDRQEQTRIKQQEADRKDEELRVQALLRTKEIQSKVDINTNIPGDVAGLD